MAQPLLDLVADADVAVTSLVGSAELVAATAIDAVVIDSRQVPAGSLFCCIRGARHDGHEFAEAAVAAGAVALVVERPLAIGVPQLVVPDVRAVVGPLAAAAHGHPARELTMVGVTGTNGKTTTVQLIASILGAAGMRCGVIGTLTGRHTTPEAPDLQALLARFRDEGFGAVAMEVSSHALAMHRVDGIVFDVAVFTNLGRDHLDLHGTMERYFAAKAMLFQPSRCRLAVVNLDDPHGRLLSDAAEVPTVGYSLLDVERLVVAPSGHSYRWNGEELRVGIGGRYNASNSLAAATAAAALGVATSVVAAGLAAAPPVPGRFEPVLAGQPFDVIVDYAHTPDGLEVAIRAAREGASGRVIVVFGCGGDRDRDKRPQMGAVAARWADAVFVTSDNPRSEDPLAIINAVCEGVPDGYRDRIVIEVDRRRAIALAFATAAAGDVVLVAGKGHETTQTVGDEVLEFDDRSVARSLLEAAR